MNEKQNKLKRLRSLLIVLGVVIAPALFRILDSGAMQTIRSIDITLIFVLGFATCAFLMTLRDYLKLKNSE